LSKNGGEAMRRYRFHQGREEEAGPGQDSFLDIVSNIVGILVILVVVACARVRTFHESELESQSDLANETPVASASFDRDDPIESESTAEDIVAEGLNENQVAAISIAELAEASQAEAARELRVEAAQHEALDRLDAAKARAETLYAETAELDGRVRLLEREQAVRIEERDRLALLVEGIKYDINAHQETLEGRQGEIFELDRQASESSQTLQELNETIALHEDQTPRITQVVHHFSTPLSQTVENREVHFRLKHGKLSEVPFRLLIGRVESGAATHLGQLRAEGIASGRVGPIAGFYMTYGLAMLPDGNVILSHSRFDADTETIGDPVKEALALDSVFMRTLAANPPDAATVTIWLYPDSYTEFYSVRQRLYEMGYVVAMRAQTEDALIGASHFGSQSAGQ
jgi:hypothetical protein